MNEAQADALLERVDLFQGLTREEVMKIFAKGMTMTCVRGDTIFRKGTEGTQMYVVLSGEIGIFDDDKCIARLHAGDMFGEMALVNKEPRSATATAVEDSRVFILSESTFERLMTKRVSIRILLNIIRTLSQRLRRANIRHAN